MLLSPAGDEVTKSALAKAAKVSRRTVINRWDDLISAIEQGCEKQCIDKKAPAVPPVTSNHPASNPTISQAYVVDSGESDVEALVDHEMWIASQEGRVPRPAIMNEVSASVGPAPPVSGRYAGAPAADVTPEITCANYHAIPAYEERYACRSDMLLFDLECDACTGRTCGSS